MVLVSVVLLSMTVGRWSAYATGKTPLHRVSFLSSSSKATFQRVGFRTETYRQPPSWQIFLPADPSVRVTPLSLKKFLMTA